MERAPEQFRQSDVTFWGITALACGAFAMICANVGAILPAGVVSSLHSPRIEGAGIEQLQAQFTRLQIESQRIHLDNEQLRSRFTMAEQNQGDVVRRVGALEVTIPTIIESSTRQPRIDRSINTAGIGDVPSETYDIDGGSVTVTQKPMPMVGGVRTPIGQQALPAMPAAAPVILAANANAFGLALGPAVTNANAQSAWQDISLKMGPLLMGLGPLLGQQASTSTKRLVVGPIADMAQATDLCKRMEKVAIACAPVPFTGEPL